VFDGFLSATSTNLNHIRFRCFTHGEGHDQSRPILKAFVETQEAYGHPPPRHVFVDNLIQEERMILEELSSIKDRQDDDLDRKFTVDDDTSSSTPCSAGGTCTAPIYPT
jgi:hypothetical protein